MKNLLVGVLPLLIWTLSIFGWCANLYKLTNCDFDAPYKAETIRMVGVVAFPVGIVLGYVSIEDERKSE